MNRKQQDYYTRVLAAVLVLSQLLPFVPRRPELVGLAATLLGLPTARKLQDLMNRVEEEDRQKGAKE